MWKKNKQIIDRPLRYPAWTFVKVGEKYYLLLNETMMEFISERAFLSWNRYFIDATEVNLSNYKFWKKIGFAPGAKIATTNGQRYIMSGLNPIASEARRVATPDIFKIGFREKDFIMVSDAELNFHERGEDISDIE